MRCLWFTAINILGGMKSNRLGDRSHCYARPKKTQLADMIGLSDVIIFKILYEDGMTKVSVRWMPIIITSPHVTSTIEESEVY